MEKLAGGRLSSSGFSQEARGAPAALLESESGAPREAGALPLSAAASALRFLSPRLPLVNQQPVSTSGAGRASPSNPCLHNAGGRAPAAAYPPAELGCALHASTAGASAHPCAPTLGGDPFWPPSSGSLDVSPLA